jgi:Tfp pilus assembly major pilin PilA
MKKLITIITLIAASSFAHADGPKFKSYVEMQAERKAKADAVSARYAAERKIAEENALAEKARAAQLKVEREEHRKKLEIAAAGATRVNVNTAVAAVAGARAWSW